MSIPSPIIRGAHLGEVLRVARETAVVLPHELAARDARAGGHEPTSFPSQAEAAARAGMTGSRPEAAWGRLERVGCGPRKASALLTAFYGAPYVAVEGDGWACAGPEFLVAMKLGCG